MDTRGRQPIAETAGDLSAAAAVRTFLIADVRGYTRFTLERGDNAAALLAGRFADVAREIVTARDGQVIELRGDEALAVFASTRQALWAASELQARFGQEGQIDPSLPLRVGIGLDAGEAIPLEGGFRGAALNLAARLCSLAAPGQVLATETVITLARKVDGLSYLDRGAAQLKGFADPVGIFEIIRQEDEEAVAAPAGGEQNAAAVEQRMPIGAFLGALPSGPMVARDEELGRVLAQMDHTQEGEGRLVLLAGEPGAGKTRLAQEATLALRDRGFVIGAGRCYEPQESVAFYPFVDALAMAYDAAPTGIKAEAGKHWPYLVRLLPEQLAGQAPTLVGEQDEQQRLFRAVTGFCQALSRIVPLALLLDDLHWADSSSLELLQYLARHTRSDRLLLLGTYRDVEVGRQHPLERSLVDLEREGLVMRIPVRRLPEEGTRELMAAALGGQEISEVFAGAIHSRTEGNPFFIQQVLRVLIERGDVYREAGEWSRKALGEIELPESVKAVVGQRVGHLDAGTQDVLRQASVLGQTFDFDDLLHVSGLEDDDLEGRLDEARVAGLVRETADDGFAFDHALTQQVLYGELAGRRRRRLHLAAGEAIEALTVRKRDRRVAELAWHFLQAQDSARALPYSLQAGDQAATVYALSDAELHYRTAIELAQELENGEQEAEASIRLGTVLRRAGRLEEALDVLERAAEMCRLAGDVESETRAMIQLGRLHNMRGSPQAAVRRVEEALPRLDDVSSGQELNHLLVELRVILAHNLWASGRYRESAALAARAADEAGELGDDRILVDARVRQGTALGFLFDPAADQVLRDILPLAETIDDIDVKQKALHNIAGAFGRQGDVARQRVLLEQDLALGRQLGDPGLTSFTLCALGGVDYHLGDWDRVRAALQEATDLVLSVPVSWHTFYPLFGLSFLAASTGDWEEAERYLGDALAALDQVDDPQGRNVVAMHQVRLDLRRGRFEAALERTQTWIAGLGPDVEERRLDEPRLMAAEAYLELGDVIRAAEMSAAPRTHLLALPDSRASVGVYLLHSRIMAGLHKWDEAEATMTRALRVCPATVSVPDHAITLYHWGRLLADHGDLAQAREQLTEALAIFGRLGDRPYTERTERALGSLVVP